MGDVEMGQIKNGLNYECKVRNWRQEGDSFEKWSKKLKYRS